jgi:hypothetical protein
MRVGNVPGTGRGQLLRHETFGEANGSERRESRRADTDTAVSMSSGRGLDGHAKRRAGSVVTRERLRGEAITQRGGGPKESRGSTR